MKKIMSYDEFKAAMCADCECVGRDDCCGCSFGDAYERYLNDMQLEDPKNAAFKEFCEYHDLMNPTFDEEEEWLCRNVPYMLWHYYPEHNLVLGSSAVCTCGIIMDHDGKLISFDPDSFKSYVCFPPIGKREALFNFVDLARSEAVFEALQLCPGAHMQVLSSDPDDLCECDSYYIKLPHDAWKYFE